MKIEGLYIVVWNHRHGTDSFLVISRSGCPTIAEVVDALGLDYERDSEEYIDLYPAGEITELAAETAVPEPAPTKVSYNWHNAGDGIELIRTWPSGKRERVGGINTNATGSTMRLERLYNNADKMYELLKQALRYIEVQTAYHGEMTAAQVEEEIKRRANVAGVEIGANSCNTLATFSLGKARAIIADMKEVSGED